MPAELSFSLKQARRLALAAQGFSGRQPPATIKSAQLNRLIERLGVLQIDQKSDAGAIQVGDLRQINRESLAGARVAEPAGLGCAGSRPEAIAERMRIEVSGQRQARLVASGVPDSVGSVRVCGEGDVGHVVILSGFRTYSGKAWVK